MYNFKLINADTDSVMIAKPDGSPFSEQEQERLISEINTMFPNHIRWEEDGYFSRCIVIKAKNYILKPYGEDKLKFKGSSIRDGKKEPALREMMDKIIYSLIENHTQEDLVNIYTSYIKEALNVTDISRWAQKKSISESVLACRDYEELSPEKLKEKGIRKNETTIWDAIKNEEDIQQGNKIYLYPAILESRLETTTLKNGKVKEKLHVVECLKLTKYWTGDHNPEKLVKRVYDTLCIFETILDMEKFIDYTLKKNQELLKELK